MLTVRISYRTDVQKKISAGKLLLGRVPCDPDVLACCEVRTNAKYQSVQSQRGVNAEPYHPLGLVQIIDGRVILMLTTACSGSVNGIGCDSKRQSTCA